MGGSRIPVYPVLLAGGIGSRLWPVSRERYPKQLVKFIGEDSLVQATARRLLGVHEPENLRVVCGGEHRHEIERHLEEIGIVPGGKVIAEPCGRNTAPAILLAVLKVLKGEDDALICIFPADHMIGDVPGFQEKLKSAVQLAEDGYVVTFGISPNFPETGYGYIEGAGEVAHGALMTRRFVEKPDYETAQKYVDAGNFFWNSGMFAFRASVILDEFKTYQPGLLDGMQRLDLDRGEIDADEYARLDNISIDYAIMEKTKKGVVLPSDFGWSDIGTWKSLYDFLVKDADMNVIDGDVIAQNTRDCFIMGYDRLIATNYLKGIVVVETPDSIFVSDMEKSRDVNQIVARLKKKGRREYHQHRTVVHPWGEATELESREGYRVLRLSIRPGSEYRPETGKSGRAYLTVVAGSGIMTGLKSDHSLKTGESLPINAEGEPLVKNTGKTDMALILVSC